MPKDAEEGERLDLQHHLLRIALGRNSYPRLRQPRAILDIACGTGIWGIEMARDFPKAEVISFDYDRTAFENSAQKQKLIGIPANFHFQVHDALQGLPFEPNRFDLTHLRFVGSFVSRQRWPWLLKEMERVTRPGGYLEVVELEDLRSPSPAFNRFKEVGKRLLDMRDLHQFPAPYVAEYMEQARVKQIQVKRVILGTGRQSERQQRLLVADTLAIWTNLQPIIVKVGLLADEEYTRLLEQLKEELPRMGVEMPILFTFGVSQG
ncbi:MAG TPA: class I SAM-dependent methyltransferase [Ktedonobacterales bacterium]|jgi:ubiquinone/menaquinone biosynthesis C-methylase UbiE